jgi:hypothetical protein
MGTSNARPPGSYSNGEEAGVGDVINAAGVRRDKGDKIAPQSESQCLTAQREKSSLHFKLV